MEKKKVGQILTLDGEDPAEVAAGSEGPVVCRRKRASAVLRPSVLLLSGPLSNKMHPQNNTLALFSSRHVRKSHQHSRVARWPPGGSLTTFTSVLVFSTSLWVSLCNHNLQNWRQSHINYAHFSPSADTDHDASCKKKTKPAEENEY